MGGVGGRRGCRGGVSAAGAGVYSGQGGTWDGMCVYKIQSVLVFQKTIHEFNLLLFPKLSPIIR